MFSKRRRAASNPTQRAPPSASASLAAAKAFVQHRESQTELSAAAASAALRSHPALPTPVGATVTKRMARRGSTSSAGSSLRRQSSVGSMTERSFRAASPAWGAPAAAGPPPVPPLPPTHHLGHGEPSAAVRRRASSLEPAQRGASPSLRIGGRGASLDRGASSTPVRPHPRPAAQLTHVAEEDASAARHSVNFSRPISPAAQTTRKPSPPTSHGWFAGPVVNHDAVQRLLTPSKSQPAGPVDPNSPDAVYDPSTRTFIRKQEAMAIHRELHQDAGDYHRPPPSPPPSDRRSPSPYATRTGAPVRPLTAARTSEPKSRPRTPESRAGAAIPSGSAENVAKAQVQVSENTGIDRSLKTTVSTEPERIENTGGSDDRVNQESPYPHLKPPAQAATANTNAAQKSASISIGQDRNASLSPHRNAHFAPGFVEPVGVKHEPLARSVSPAKSALKSSPSVSRRSHSPIASNGRLTNQSASSEASDAGSDTGLPQRKKSVRVSFEEAPVVVSSGSRSEAASATAQPGLGASKWSSIVDKDKDFEDFMKPRGALPVFGSIREKERRPQSDDVAEKVTETVTTPMSASIGSIMEHPETSNDHALGHLVTQAFAQKSAASDNPVSHQTVTMERTGYTSDSSDEYGAQKHGGPAESYQPSSVPEPKSLTTKSNVSPSAAPISQQVVEVPQLAFQPATPSPHERPEPKFQAMTAPSGAQEETGNAVLPKANGPVENPEKDPQIAVTEDEEAEDDNSSVYSDAYEDLTDNEAVFGSIDALMTSPAKPPSSGLMASKFANNATESDIKTPKKVGLDFDADADVTAVPGQDAAQQHWIGGSADHEQSQPNGPLHHGDSHIGPVFGLAKEPTARLSTENQEVQTNTQTPPSQAAQTTKPLKSALKKTTASQLTPAPEPKMRNSMRGPLPSAEGASGVHLKKSMRSGGMNSSSRADPSIRTSLRGSLDNNTRAQTRIRQSMRSTGTPPATTSMGLAASRHSMPPVQTEPPRGALQKKHIHSTPPISITRPHSMPAVKKTTTAEPTYDSDSDASASSFQRTRAHRRGQGGRMTMRGSMRDEPTPTMRAATSTPKQVVAISPPGSPSPAIRRSMRSSSPTPDTVKSSRFSIRSLSPMGRFRSSKGSDIGPSLSTHSKPMPTFSKQFKSNKQKAPVATRAKAFTSRFVDSSDDDDDALPRHFQSRFADSDDDEPIDYQLPAGYTPVRGIPRTQNNDDDSTDLEEEEEEDLNVSSTPISKASPVAGSTNNGQTNGKSNGQGTALASGSLRDSKWAPTTPSSDTHTPTKSKRGLFGIGKKRSASFGQTKTPEPATTPSDIHLPPAQRDRELGVVLTPIEEDRDFDTLVASSPASKKSTKLQRRSTPDWPLAPPPVIGNEARPVSSDGVMPHRPRFANRQSSQISNATAPTANGQGQPVSYGRTGKKKKFQGLRRVFGLND